MSLFGNGKDKMPDSNDENMGEQHSTPPMPDGWDEIRNMSSASGEGKESAKECSVLKKLKETINSIPEGENYSRPLAEEKISQVRDMIVYMYKTLDPNMPRRTEIYPTEESAKAWDDLVFLGGVCFEKKKQFSGFAHEFEHKRSNGIFDELIENIEKATDITAKLEQDEAENGGYGGWIERCNKLANEKIKAMRSNFDLADFKDEECKGEGDFSVEAYARMSKEYVSQRDRVFAVYINLGRAISLLSGSAGLQNNE